MVAIYVEVSKKITFEEILKDFSFFNLLIYLYHIL